MCKTPRWGTSCREEEQGFSGVGSCLQIDGVCVCAQGPAVHQLKRLLSDVTCGHWLLFLGKKESLVY